MLVITRHRVPAEELDSFLSDARAAVALLAAQAGCQWIEVGRAVDDADLVVIASRWDDVGSYRHALSSFDVKVGAVPLLSTAIDEATAFEVLHSVGPGGVIDSESSLNPGEWALGRPGLQ